MYTATRNHANNDRSLSVSRFAVLSALSAVAIAAAVIAAAAAVVRLPESGS